MTLLLALFACSSPAPAPEAVAPEAAPAKPAPLLDPALLDLAKKAAETDVIVISMDCLRQDRTGLDPRSPEATPGIRSFAEQAVVFHDAMSSASWTVPSHMAIWTGRWPTRHGLVNKLAPDASGTKLVDAALRPEVKTYPETLVGKGWTAAAFTGDAGVSNRFGFGRGFATFLDDRKFGGMDHSGPPAKAWLEQHRSEQMFLFFHGYDVHGQAPLPEGTPVARGSYSGPLDGGIQEQAKYREQALAQIKKPGDKPTLEGVLSKEDAAFLLSVYDQKIAVADSRMAEFLAALKATGAWDNSIVALVSDHGEEFMEHHSIDHGYSIYQEQLHVPFLIHFPGQKQRVDVKAPVRTIDLFPTIFDALGYEQLPDVDGRSLLPFLRGEAPEPPGPLLAESDYRLFVHHRALRKGDYKLILDLSDGGVELYDLSKDPGEQQDLSKTDTRRAYEMEQELRGELLKWQTDPAVYLGRSEAPIAVY
jgi:arylsulfatase A-like enzyme